MAAPFATVERGRSALRVAPDGKRTLVLRKVVDDGSPSPTHGRRSKELAPVSGFGIAGGYGTVAVSGPFVAKGLLNPEGPVALAKIPPKWLVEQWDGTGKKQRDDWVAEPRYRTRSEMKKAQRDAMMPDLSMDIDGDGVVSAKDFKMACAFDDNGDGVLQTTERRHLRQVKVDDAIGRLRALQRVR